MKKSTSRRLQVSGLRLAYQELLIMRKWIVGAVSALVLAGLLSGPTGCGPGKATQIDTSGHEAAQPAGHDQAVKSMEKKSAK